MPDRRLPVRPSLAHLQAEASALVADGRAATTGDARRQLAQEYGAEDWTRIEQACGLIDAIWADDIDTVRDLLVAHPTLLHEDALVRRSNWGRPMSYAANLGRDRIITMLHEMGATDHEFAIDRAALQGQVETARMLHGLAGGPTPGVDALGGPAYTLSASGTAFVLELGAPVVDAKGRGIAPVHVVLESDSRKPEAKHAILEMYAERGYPFPDTPMMAFHRGRLDLLEAHLRAEPALLTRTFAFAEIFPPELGCGEESFPRTPLDGSTLLHLCVEFDEMDIALRLLERGMGVDARAAVDAEGFGGHTALFNAVVCYANFWGNYQGGAADSRFARLLLDRGADPDARASLRASYRINFRVDDVPGSIEARDVTPVAWGEAFPYKLVVGGPAMELIAGVQARR